MMEDINIGKDTIIGTVTTKVIEANNPAKLTKEEEEILMLTEEIWNNYLSIIRWRQMRW